MTQNPDAGGASNFVASARSLRPFRSAEPALLDGHEPQPVPTDHGPAARTRRLPSARTMIARKRATPTPVDSVPHSHASPAVLVQPPRSESRLALDQNQSAAPLLKPAEPEPSRPNAAELLQRIHADANPVSQSSTTKRSVPIAVHQPIDQRPELPRAAAMRRPERRALSLREWTMPVRWWNAMPLSVALALAVFAFAWITAENLSASLELTRLAAKLDNPQVDRRRLADDLAGRVDSPLSRFDARRDYTLARVLSAIDEGPNKSSQTPDRPDNAQAVYHNVSRAAQRSPANPWYRLTRALLADQFAWGAAEQKSNWETVERLVNSEANYWRRWADHLRLAERMDEAMAAYRRFLAIRPQATVDLLQSLAAARVSIKDQLQAVPDSRMALGQAVAYFKEIGLSDWRALADRTMALAPAEGVLSIEEKAAEAMVAQALGQVDRAAELLADAVKARPDQVDWKQRLAQLHYDRREFGEAARLADAIVRADPSGEYAAAARLLRERISLAVGASPIGRAN